MDGIRQMNRILENQALVLRDREYQLRQKNQKAIDEQNRLRGEKEDLQSKLVMLKAYSKGNPPEIAQAQDQLTLKIKMLTELVENLKYFKQELDQVICHWYLQEKEESRRLREQNELLKQQILASQTNIDEATKTEFLQGLANLKSSLERICSNVTAIYTAFIAFH